MSAIAKRLSELRKKYKLSQTEVARLLGVTPALISAYEKCERTPSIERLISLADIYHTSTDYILGRRRTNDNDAVLLDVTNLSENQIRILRELIEDMSKNN
jgi:transcriptional regulator with XRE-family HTH domain